MALKHWIPLHEWSGNATDLSENGISTSQTISAQGVWGVGGLTSYGFDGSNDYVDLGADRVPAPFTISAWCYLGSSPSSRKEVVSNYATDHPSGFHHNGASSYRFQINDSTDGWTTVASTPEEIGSWVHLTLVYDGTKSNGGTTIAYKNASVVGSYVSNGLANKGSQNTVIGRRSDSSNGGYWPGYISDVRLFDHALSPLAVRELYERGTGDYTKRSLHDGTDSGAVSRWFVGTDVTADSWGSNTLTDNTSAGTTSDAIDGDAKSFDGSDDYMDASGVDGDIQSPVTVSHWVKFDGTGAQSSFDHGGGRFEFNFDHDVAGEVAFKIYDTDPSAHWVSHSISTGSWYHLVGTWDGTTLELFVNGVLVGTNTANGLNEGNQGTAIGAEAGGASNNMNGDVDDVRVFSRVLDPWEVFQLYQWGTGGRDLRQRTVIA